MIYTLYWYLVSNDFLGNEEHCSKEPWTLIFVNISDYFLRKFLEIKVGLQAIWLLKIFVIFYSLFLLHIVKVLTCSEQRIYHIYTHQCLIVCSFNLYKLESNIMFIIICNLIGKQMIIIWLYITFQIYISVI